MVAEEQSGRKATARFRFLKREEYEALSQEKRAEYLKEAFEALTSGRPLDVPPDRTPKH